MKKISFDPAKRNATFANRGLDFAEAEEVFSGPVFEQRDERFDYGELRYITVGFLRARMVVVVWTPHGAVRHIISMRKANDREQARYEKRLG